MAGGLRVVPARAGVPCSGCGARFVPHRSDVRHCIGCLLSHLSIAAAEVATAWRAERQRRGGRG